MRDLTEAEARELTNRIKGNVAAVLDLIAAAYEGRAHVALGYASWAHYCHAEFPAIRYQDRGQRDGAVVALEQRGMSGRAISSALCMDDHTVRRILRQAGDTQVRGAANAAPRNSTLGLDGGVYPRRREPTSCSPIPVRATIRNAVVHYARQAAKLVADLDAQDYPPGFLTPAEVAAIDQFRQGVRDFAQTIEREHAARMAREDSE